MMEGFMFRLEQQLRRLILDEPKYERVGPAVSRMVFVSGPVQPNVIGWVGGTLKLRISFSQLTHLLVWQPLFGAD